MFYLVKTPVVAVVTTLLSLPLPDPHHTPSLSCELSLLLPLSQRDFQVNTSELISLWRRRRATVDGVNVRAQRGAAEDGGL